VFNTSTLAHRCRRGASTPSEPDFAPFNELMTVLSAPHEEQPAFATYTDPPPPDQRVYRTFCGT